MRRSYQAALIIALAILAGIGFAYAPALPLIIARAALSCVFASLVVVLVWRHGRSIETEAHRRLDHLYSFHGPEGTRSWE